MKKSLLFILLIVCASIKAQIVTEFTPPEVGSERWNNTVSSNYDYTYFISKIKVYSDGVVAIVKIQALKNIRELRIGNRGRLVYGDEQRYEYIGLQGAGIGENGDWYKGGVTWNGLKSGATATFQIVFSNNNGKSTIPDGAKDISIKGIEVTANGKTSVWSSTRTIDNPHDNNTTNFTSEYTIKQHLDANNDGICGIYEEVDSEYNSRFACVKYNGKHTLIFLSDNMGRSWWKTGDIKAELIPSEHEGLFTANWYMSDKSVNKEVIVGFDKNIMSAIFSPGKSNEESNYYKRVYPTELPIKAQLNEVIPLLENENFQEAVKSLSRIIDRINRTSQSKQAYKNEAYSAYMLRAYAYIALELYKSALLDYDNALICKPGDENAYYQRGRLKLELNDINGAIDDMKRGGEMGRAILREYGLLNNNSQRTNGNTPPLKKQQIPELKKQQ